MAVLSAQPLTVGAPALFPSYALSGLPLLPLDLPAQGLKPQPETTQPAVRRLGRFRVTFYWLVEEDQYPAERTVPLFTRHGELLGYFPCRFVRDFRMESCARLSDGRLISDPEPGNRCRVVDAPLGSRDYTLTALKSVAVDPSVVPMGAQLYIPAAAGIKLGPDSVHDGRFLAQDAGALIQGRHIDIYVGPKSNLDLFQSSSLCRSGRADVYLVSGP